MNDCLGLSASGELQRISKLREAQSRAAGEDVVPLYICGTASDPPQAELDQKSGRVGSKLENQTVLKEAEQKIVFITKLLNNEAKKTVFNY